MESTNEVKVIIREGQESDCETILKLLKDLAAYEGMPEKVKITAEDLKRDAFHTSPPVVYTLVAELSEDEILLAETEAPENKRIVGYVLYFYTYSTWKGQALHLEDIFVQPEYRKQGVGEKFLTHLAKIAQDKNFARITLECINWNELAMSFYRKLGGVDVTATEHWHSYRFMSDALKKLAKV